jgi:ADP-heptose:LPS heptosyltransferase
MYEDGYHEIARNYKLLSGFEPLKKYWKTEVYSKNDDCFTLQDKIGNVLNIDQEPFAVIFNGGRSKLRRLSNLKVESLCRKIYNNYSLKCCYVGDQNDYFDGADIKELIGKDAHMFINLCGLIDFIELKDLIAHAKLFIGNDSAISQLSASTDTPTISLFGPVDPVQAKPLGKNKRIIYHKYSCSPCLQEICIITGSKETSACMSDIEVEEIMLRIRELIVFPP